MQSSYELALGGILRSSVSSGCLRPAVVSASSSGKVMEGGSFDERIKLKQNSNEAMGRGPTGLDDLHVYLKVRHILSRSNVRG